jgi:hypothetical protein
LALAACDSAAPTPAPDATTWSAPTDWKVVATDGGDLQLTLPPWLGVFDNRGAIFANEPPPLGAEIPVQLLAKGPDRAAQLEFGANLVAWIELHVSGSAHVLRNPGEGVPAVTRVRLPAGSALRYERVDRAGTALEWRFLVFAIQTPTGLAYLQFDGTATGWAERSAEFDHIAQLLRTR